MNYDYSPVSKENLIIENEWYEHYHFDIEPDYIQDWIEYEKQSFEMEEHYLEEDRDNRLINLEFDSLVFIGI